MNKQVCIMCGKEFDGTAVSRYCSNQCMEDEMRLLEPIRKIIESHTEDIQIQLGEKGNFPMTIIKGHLFEILREVHSKYEITIRSNNE